MVLRNLILDLSKVVIFHFLLGQNFGVLFYIILLNPRLKRHYMPTIIHPFLNDGVEARAYQIRSLRSALTSSSLMVMPTGFGKTAVEWMAMAEFLMKDEGKILLIAPTTGLVEQQERMAREMINLQDDQISRYTGEIAPKSRPEIWHR